MSKLTEYSFSTLGTVPMAAYSLTFNLGFATSQLCESISVAAQCLIARDIPLDSPRYYLCGYFSLLMH
jgi:hypothetical protein